MTVEQKEEVISLRKQLADAQQEKEEAESELSEDTSDLAQGLDPHNLQFKIKYFASGDWQSESFNTTMTWDSIFSSIGSMMLDEAAEKELRNRLALVLYLEAEKTQEDMPDIDHLPRVSFDLYSDQWEEVLIQLRALGLIDKGQKKRQISDDSKYFRLTDRGDRALVRLRAARRGSPARAANQDPTLEPNPAEEETSTRPQPKQ